MFEEQFDRIRKVSQEMGCFSWTSREYQDDILNYLLEYRHRGCGVIEVGCYKGGLSALIACLCREFKWPFYTIDIDEAAVTSTRNLLSLLDLSQDVTFHHGTLASFVSIMAMNDRPALIILDGDHRYEAVLNDIHDVYRLKRLPYAAVFHDFSLRHPTSGEKVDQAVKDSLGDRPIRQIGARMDGSGKYPTKDKPSDDGHWWEVPGSEGAIVELAPQISPLEPTSSTSNPGFRSLFSLIRGVFSPKLRNNYGNSP
jgi:cephalosporin hydroxylase